MSLKCLVMGAFMVLNLSTSQEPRIFMIQFKNSYLVHTFPKNNFEFGSLVRAKVCRTSSLTLFPYSVCLAIFFIWIMECVDYLFLRFKPMCFCFGIHAILLFHVCYEVYLLWMCVMFGF